MRPAFVVTGTDTDVGKTVLAAALVAALNGCYWKPVQAGLAGETDADIVRRILAGEEDLFESLVRRYQIRVQSHVARMVGNRDDALDLSQEIFVKVFQALDRYNPEYKFSTWLFRIAGNAAIDHLRKRRPRTVPPP